MYTDDGSYTSAELRYGLISFIAPRPGQKPSHDVVVTMVVFSF